MTDSTRLASELRMKTPDYHLRSNAISNEESRRNRSGFNTSKEIQRYEQLNREALVKVSKLQGVDEGK